jgi:hypothetical protein
MDETTQDFMKKQFEELSQQVYDAENKPIINIHVDVETVLDLRIGTLLAMISTETEYQYILSRLPQYEQAFDRKVAKYFPALGFTEEHIKQYRANPKHHTNIIRLSPMTQLHSLFPKFIETIQEGNVLCPTYNQDPITLTFWSVDIPIDVVVQARLCKAIYDTRINTKFEFVCKPFNEVELVYIRGTHIWFVYDVEVFHACPNVGTVMCTEYAMPQVIVMAMQRVKDEYADLPKEKIIEDLAPVVAGLNLVCEFAFFDHHIQREVIPDA